MEYIEVGGAPAEESCAQVGQPYYPETSRRECKVFIRMLQRLFPIPDGLQVRYVTRSSQHEFGTYREVAIAYDDSGDPQAAEAAAEFAFAVERGTPSHWDTVSRYELCWFERKEAYSNAVQEGRLTFDELPPQFRTTNPPSLPADVSLREMLEAHPI